MLQWLELVTSGYLKASVQFKYVECCVVPLGLPLICLGVMICFVYVFVLVIHILIQKYLQNCPMAMVTVTSYVHMGHWDKLAALCM